MYALCNILNKFNKLKIKILKHTFIIYYYYYHYNTSFSKLYISNVDFDTLSFLLGSGLQSPSPTGKKNTILYNIVYN